MGRELFYFIDLLGVFTGALAGALVACRFRFDITGLFTLALVSGLGGGFIRDVLIGSGPPLSLTEPAYLPTVVLATAISAVFGWRIDRLQRIIVIIDALALVNFAVGGSLRALDAGMNLWSTMLLGVITAVGGGLIREVLTGEKPTIFRRSEFYALAALGTCVVVIIMNALDVPRELTFVTGLAVGMFLRLASVRRGWMSWQPGKVSSFIHLIRNPAEYVGVRRGRLRSCSRWSPGLLVGRTCSPPVRASVPSYG